MMRTLRMGEGLTVLARWLTDLSILVNWINHLGNERQRISWECLVP